VTRKFKDWRTEIDALDMEIVRLCERRVRLATEMLKTLTSELSLGALSHDADRLTLLLFENVESSTLDPTVVAEFFRLLTMECRRAAEESVRLSEGNVSAA